MQGCHISEYDFTNFWNEIYLILFMFKSIIHLENRIVMCWGKIFGIHVVMGVQNTHLIVCHSWIGNAEQCTLYLQQSFKPHLLKVDTCVAYASD